MVRKNDICMDESGEIARWCHLMPELPEVETVKAALVPVMTGATIINAEICRPDLRFPLPPHLASFLDGAVVDYVHRRAKIILIGAKSQVMMLHLGMSGSVRITDHKPNIRPHDHLEITVDNNGKSYWITYNDPRRFGYIDLVPETEFQVHKAIAQLGPEPVPVSASFAQDQDLLDLSYLNEALSAVQSPIKSFLLDQRKIAGLGNIYVCEALYRAGISPRRRAASIKGKRAERLLPAIQNVLTEAIAQGGTSLRDHKQPDGKLGYFVQSLDVYGRQGAPCHRCETPIRQITQSGRSTFYCPSCQR